MTDGHPARTGELFDQAVKLDEGQREEFVRTACGGDKTLEVSVLALLEHREAARSVLEGPTLTMERMVEIVSSGLRTFLSGELVADRFRIGRFIAQGGMGEVYEAEDLELVEMVAIKTIRPALARDEEMLARFKQEIALARKVTHGNVARVFDLFRHEVILDGERRAIVFLSMELLEGETLAERISRKGRLSAREAQAVALQVISGLAAAHAAGIIHRDLKSSNIALVPSAAGGERAVIMDFGLAASERSLEGLGHGGFAGTPAYMAPEQVSGGAITPAADIYALGIVLFEMLSGTRPFPGNSLETALVRLREDAPRLRKVAPDAPLRWERTVAACLAREPARRPASAGEVEWRLTGRRERRRRLRAAAVAFSALMLLSAGLYWARQPHRPAPAAEVAVRTARVTMQNLTHDGFVAAIGDYRRAIEADPRWAEPWAELAYAYATAANAKQIPPEEAIPQARTAAQNAIRLDRHSAKAYAALGWVQSLDYDEWPRAEDSFRRALALDSGQAEVHFWLGVHLRKKGDFPAAEAEVRQALKLQQDDPAMWWELAFLFWTAGRLDRMQEVVSSELLVMFPNYGFTRYLHARLLKEQKRLDEALEELRFSERLGQAAYTVLAERASVYAYANDAGRARAALRQLEEASATEPVDGLLIAGVYARLGDFDSAFRWLEAAYSRRDNTLLSLKTSPVLEPLRGDPRYRALLARLHFETN